VSDQELKNLLEPLGQAARKAARFLATASTETKNRLLNELAVVLEESRERITEANAIDVAKAKGNGLSGAMVDRLTLTPKRVDGMIQGIRDVMRLQDPVGEILKQWTLPNGLEMEKVRVPLGVIGIIYESRPNVTIDAGILCLKTGNATILRGGSEAFASNSILVELVQEACRRVGAPQGVVSLVPTTAREAIPVFCRMDRYIDLMIPRGGHGLIETVVEHARMPVIKHFHGVCHVYVHEKADPVMARNLVINAKCQRPGVCNAMETLLIDRSIAPVQLPGLGRALREAGVEIRGDAEVAEWVGGEIREPENWTTEYLDLILAVRIVDGVNQAMDHIETFGSHHSDTIVTEDERVAESFLRGVDSAAVYWNASTRFTDGAEFGFGAEIGISTDKIHARGPMALEELTSYKYVARGTGQVRG
jgi:glutamate-5-semialdehyde dehydrogenase